MSDLKANEQVSQVLAGLKVIENAHLTIPDGTVEVRRTMRERLLTRPWSPFKKFNTVARTKPSRQIYRVPGAFIMHPALAAEIRCINKNNIA